MFQVVKGGPNIVSRCYSTYQRVWVCLTSVKTRCFLVQCELVMFWVHSPWNVAWWREKTCSLAILRGFAPGQCICVLCPPPALPAFASLACALLSGTGWLVVPNPNLGPFWIGGMKKKEGIRKTYNSDRNVNTSHRITKCIKRHINNRLIEPHAKRKNKMRDIEGKFSKG